MSVSRINLSKKEIFRIQDQDFLQSKIEIGKKIEELMGAVEQRLEATIKNYSWPEGVLTKSGKLSKGENYRGLPYYMLDFPRRFSQQGVFTFRTMFWWGNFFSATLHLSGKYLESRREALLSNLEPLRSSQAYVCVHETPWEYHYGSDNYKSVKQLNSQELTHLISTKPFVKISHCWSLEQYGEIPKLVSSVFHQMLDLTINQS